MQMRNVLQKRKLTSSMVAIVNGEEGVDHCFFDHLRGFDPAFTRDRLVHLFSYMT